MLSAHQISRVHKTALEALHLVPILILISGFVLISNWFTQREWQYYVTGLILSGVALSLLKLASLPGIRAQTRANVLPHRRSELRSLSLQSWVSLNSALISGVVLAFVGVLTALLLAWLTNLFGLKN